MNDFVVDFDPAHGYLTIVLCVSALSLLIAALLARYVIAQDPGTPQMQRISNTIRQGAAGMYFLGTLCWPFIDQARAARA